MLNQAQKDNVKKLLAALRSGAYVQGQMYLKQIQPGGNTEYCCLGVAAEAVLGMQFQRIPGRNFCTYDGGPHTGTLRVGDAEEFGFNQYVTKEEAYALGIGVPTDSTRQNALIAMNDRGYTFGHIAKLIELVGWDNA